MSNVYIVIGECGYQSLSSSEDYKNWLVAAYQDIDKAREHVRLANNKSMELGWPKNCVAGAMGVLDNTGEVVTDEPHYNLRHLELLDEIPT